MNNNKVVPQLLQAVICFFFSLSAYTGDYSKIVHNSGSCYWYLYLNRWQCIRVVCILWTWWWSILWTCLSRWSQWCLISLRGKEPGGHQWLVLLPRCFFISIIDFFCPIILYCIYKNRITFNRIYYFAFFRNYWYVCKYHACHAT